VSRKINTTYTTYNNILSRYVQSTVQSNHSLVLIYKAALTPTRLRRLQFVVITHFFCCRQNLFGERKRTKKIPTTKITFPILLVPMGTRRATSLFYTKTQHHSPFPPLALVFSFLQNNNEHGRTTKTTP
jgi:hypothetical protein